MKAIYLLSWDKHLGSNESKSAQKVVTGFFLFFVPSLYTL